MIPLYVALGVEWAIWFGGVVSTSVFVKDCKQELEAYYGYGYSYSYRSYNRRDATGDCLNITR
jgi:hypothetical protein